MAANSTSIDYLKWMRVFAQTSPEDFDGRLDTDWITTMCRTAEAYAFATCPAAPSRFNDESLSEDTLAYVVCEMVLRVARWQKTKQESNGTYNYTDYEPHSSPPGYDSSPNLFMTAPEKALLEGTTEDSGPMGTVQMGLDRIWGR